MTHGYSDDFAGDKAAIRKRCSAGRCRIRAFGASAAAGVSQGGADGLNPARNPQPEQVEGCFLHLSADAAEQRQAGIGYGSK